MNITSKRDIDESWPSLHDSTRSVLAIVANECEKARKKGYGTEHDDEHDDGSIGLAAFLVLQDMYGNAADAYRSRGVTWPFERAEKWHKENPVTRLAIAGQLLVAEAARIMRHNEWWIDRPNKIADKAITIKDHGDGWAVYFNGCSIAAGTKDEVAAIRETLRRELAREIANERGRNY